MKRVKLRRRLDSYFGKDYWKHLSPRHKYRYAMLGAYGVWRLRRDGMLERFVTQEIEGSGLDREKVKEQYDGTALKVINEYLRNKKE